MIVRSSRTARLADLGTYLFLGIVSVLVLAPIYWIAATSIKPTPEILVTPTTLLTANPTLDHFAVALASDFRRYLVNSLLAAGGATAISFVLAVPPPGALPNSAIRARPACCRSSSSPGSSRPSPWRCHSSCSSAPSA